VQSLIEGSDRRRWPSPARRYCWGSLPSENGEPKVMDLPCVERGWHRRSPIFCEFFCNIRDDLTGLAPARTKVTDGPSRPVPEDRRPSEGTLARHLQTGMAEKRRRPSKTKMEPKI